MDYLTDFNYWALLKYASYASICYLWYKLYTCDRKYVSKYFFEKGKNISGKMKSVKYWDTTIEPFIIREFGIMFTAGNSFIKGLISDNENIEELGENIDNFATQITEELESLDKMVSDMDKQKKDEKDEYLCNTVLLYT